MDDEHLVDSDAAPLTPCSVILANKDLIDVYVEMTFLKQEGSK